MKKTILTIVFMLVTVWANAQFCNKYADKAVAQYKTAKSNNLPNINWPVWSDDWKGHYNWCKTVSEDVATKQTVLRESYLNKYIQKTANIPLHKDRKENTEANDVTLEVLKGVVKSQPKLQTKTVIVAKTPDVNVVPSVTTIPFYTDRVRLLSSEKYTVGHNLSAGGNERSTVYRDRDFLYWKIPTYLQGVDYLMTNNQDKFTSGNNFFTIHHPKTSHPVIAYVAADTQLTPPAWLLKQGYIDMNDQLKIWIPDNNSYKNFKIYKKIFHQGGDMVFGGNQNTQNQKQGNMYLVFFNIKGSRPVIDISSYDKDKKINVTGKATITVTDNGNENNYSKLIKEDNLNRNEKENMICSTQYHELNHKSTSSFVFYDERNKELFPGCILSISEIESGHFTPATTPKRKPYTISTNINGITNPTGIVKLAKIDEYRKTKADILNPKNLSYPIGTKSAFGDFKSIESATELSVETNTSFHYLFYSGEASASYKSTNKRNQYILSIDNIYYTISFSPDQSGFFENPNIPNNPDWVYVSSITYGNKLILNIESDYSKEKVKAALKAAYETGVTGVKGNFSLEYSTILDNLYISVITLGEFPGKSLRRVITSPSQSTFADIYANNKIYATTSIIPLSYTLRYVDGNHKTAYIETYAKYKEQKCRKMSNILEFKFHDIYVVRSDDEHDGEDLRGWMKIRPWGYNEKEVFNQKFEENKEGGESPILLSPNKLYYFKYSYKGLDDPMKNLEIEAYLMEDDDGSADDDFGHSLVRVNLNKIFSGAIYEEQTLIDNGLKIPDSWKHETSLNNHTCNKCLVMPFSHDNSKVLIRFTIDLPEKLPAGKSFSN